MIPQVDSIDLLTAVLAQPEDLKMQLTVEQKCSRVHMFGASCTSASNHTWEGTEAKAWLVAANLSLARFAGPGEYCPDACPDSPDG